MSKARIEWLLGQQRFDLKEELTPKEVLGFGGHDEGEKSSAASDMQHPSPCRSWGTALAFVSLLTPVKVEPRKSDKTIN